MDDPLLQQLFHDHPPGQALRSPPAITRADARELIAAAAKSTPPIGIGGAVPGLAALSFALAKAMEALAWLAVGDPREDAGRDTRDRWDQLGEAIIGLGGAALRASRAIAPGPQPGQERASSCRAQPVWQREPNRKAGLATFSTQVCDLVLDAMDRLARHEPNLARPVLEQLVSECVEAVAWLSPRLAPVVPGLLPHLTADPQRASA